MEALIVPDHAKEVTRMLVAVDDFLAANDALCRYVREHVALGISLTIDQSELAARLDIFSRYVDLLSETIDGDQAVVVFQVDRDLPLKRAILHRIDGRWRYDPGPGYREEIPRAFASMAAGLRRVHDDLRSGRLPLAELKQDPARLGDEVRLRLSPGVRMLPAGE